MKKLVLADFVTICAGLFLCGIIQAIFEDRERYKRIGIRAAIEEVFDSTIAMFGIAIYWCSALAGAYFLCLLPGSIDQTISSIPISQLTLGTIGILVLRMFIVSVTILIAFVFQFNIDYRRFWWVWVGLAALLIRAFIEVS